MWSELGAGTAVELRLRARVIYATSPQAQRLDALIGVRTECPDARVIMLNQYEGDVPILRALEAVPRDLPENMSHSR